MLRTVLPIALVHLLLTYATAFAARGWDLDHTVGRSPVSQVSGIVNGALLLPHNAVLPLVPSSWWMLGRPVALAMILANSLLYGLVLFAAWRLLAAFLKRGGTRHAA